MRNKVSFRIVFGVFMGLLALGGKPAFAQTDLSLYSDQLDNGWQNWSWDSTTGAAATPAHTGANSLAVTYTKQWAGLNLVFQNGVNLANYAAVTFWIHGGGTTAHNIHLKTAISSNYVGDVPITNYLPGNTVPANSWAQVTVPLSALNSTSGSLTGIILQEQGGIAEPTYYVDDVKLAAPTVGSLSINTAAPLQTLDDRSFGMNTAIWDTFNTPATVSLLNAADVRTLRFPGGSLSDEYHWKTNTNLANTWTWVTSFDSFAAAFKQMHSAATGAAPNVFITVNYGTGTAQEAADWVTYANVTKKLNIKYWEIGNECYGSWETDTTSRAHDPAVYATRARDYMNAMRAVDPTIKIGVVVETGEDNYANYTGATDASATNPRTGVKHYGWTPVVLNTLKNLGVLPDYVIYHRYEQGPGNENDATLLQAASTWGNDAANLRQQITDYLGATNGAKIELTCTEDNSVYTTPGKQSTSLVNGLYLADSAANLYKTEFKTAIWWNFRNGNTNTGDAGQNNSASLYGWRNYGDYGIMNGAGNDCYPTYYTTKLLAQFARGGDSILTASSNYSLLSVYAAKRADGSYTALVINKSPTATLTGSLNFTQSLPRLPVSTISYGIPQDNAAQTGVGNRDLAAGSLNWPASGNFTASFAPYSATVLRFVGTGAVTGRIALEGVSNLATINSHAPLGTFHIGFRNPNTTTEVYAADVALTTASGSAFGTFSLPNAPRGTFDIGIKGAKNLRVLLPAVAIGAATTLRDASLPAGDANSDNSVDSSDFGVLIGAFGADVSIPGSGYDPTVDFNFDGIVDSTDFGLLIGEFNNTGAN